MLDMTLKQALKRIEALEGEREQLIAEMIEQECIRCHHRFTGFEEQRYCTKDCADHITPAPSYEEWYLTLHPDRDPERHECIQNNRK